MQAGVITVNGAHVGLIEINLSDEKQLSDFEGYTPTGRAEGGTSGGEQHRHGIGHFHTDAVHKNQHHFPGHLHHPAPGHHHHPGHDQSPVTHESAPGRVYPQGSAETDAAIQRAAERAGVDVNTMRGIASIESGMNPASNANRSTQYKGLYQIGRNEWQRTGQGGNIYSAQDNAMAAARLFTENKRQFRGHFGRDPTDTELYLMHQQGLGFYTRGAMTNIGGNPYPGMSGPQTHESFEAGWGRELARRKAGFAKANPVTLQPRQSTTYSQPEDL